MPKTKVNMTAQFPAAFIFDRQTVTLFSSPLSGYFKLGRPVGLEGFDRYQGGFAAVQRPTSSPGDPALACLVAKSTAQMNSVAGSQRELAT